MLRNPFLLFALLLLIGFTSCDDDDSGDGGPLVGSGNVITDTRSFDRFEQVNVFDDIDVNITFGSAPTASVRTDDNIAGTIVTQLDGRVLTIRRRVGVNYGDVDVTVDVTTPTLIAVRADNAADVSFDGFRSPTTEIVIEGRNASMIEGTNSQASNIKLNVLNNASNANLYGVEAPTASVDVANSSTLEIAVTDRIAGTVRNNSTLRYQNTPDITALTTAGGGMIVDAN